MDNWIKKVKIESCINIGDEMPFALVNSTGEALWMCGPDEQGRITSVFQNPKKKEERQITYLKNKDEALQHRSLLKDEGWIEAKIPEISVTSQK